MGHTLKEEWMMRFGWTLLAVTFSSTTNSLPAGRLQLAFSERWRFVHAKTPRWHFKLFHGILYAVGKDMRGNIPNGAIPRVLGGRGLGWLSRSFCTVHYNLQVTMVFVLNPAMCVGDRSMTFLRYRDTQWMICQPTSVSQHRVAQTVGSQRACGRIRGWRRVGTFTTRTRSRAVIGGRRDMA
jgi:hypothetical protein